MITNNERAAVQLSATKKDYYQIWNELLDLAGKISERWDPTSTNESDPGIVLLKVLTALGDKLNYNIDVNTLEAFIPSAAQTESMRNICAMLGYNMKYFQSATTEVSIAYKDEWPKTSETEEFPNTSVQLELPMFTTITNEEKDISYITIEPCIFSKNNPAHKLKCMEGQIVQCETSNNNIITIDQLDDNNRFYLPEYQIAENGIFIYRIVDSIKSPKYWKKVDHLAAQPYNSLVYEFGYDSKESRPYIKFPDDISQIIEDGLEIFYVRTSGLNGNIAANTLNTFEKPTFENWENIDVKSFKVRNISATTNGRNEETITQAYENYKKTVGTFDTLVTCRDYMNKIYNLILSDGVNAVSNIIAADIRSDINNSVIICSFNDYGIAYLDTPIKDTNGNNTINNFDLILYPFTTIRDLNNKDEYKNSFKYFTSNNTEIEALLTDNKTISHNIKYPKSTDIVCIKNYLKLSAKITTVNRIKLEEEQFIKDAIKQNIFKTFNARKLDFGEAIPFDSILECIENADKRIKNVSLFEPTLYTKFELANGQEYGVGSYVINPTTNEDLVVQSFPGRTLYNKLALRNILAGRVELFNYNKDFSFELNENKYTANIDKNGGVQTEYSEIYPNADTNKLVKIKTFCSFPCPQKVSTESSGNPSGELLLKEHEVISFRAPSFKTTKTYPAYINYYLKLNTDPNQDKNKKAIPATFNTIYTFMTSASVNIDTPNNIESAEDKWKSLTANVPIENFIDITDRIVQIADTEDNRREILESESNAALNNQVQTYGCVIKNLNATDPAERQYFVYKEGTEIKISIDDTDKFFYFPLNGNNFGLWINWLKSLIFTVKDEHIIFNGIYRIAEIYTAREPGHLIDIFHRRYQLATTWWQISDKDALKNYTVQQFNPEAEGSAKDGTGVDAEYSGIPANTEYKLKHGEYLAINYTPVAAEGQKEEDVKPINRLLSGDKHWDSELHQYVEYDIIKPNFELIDSKKYHDGNGSTTHRYAKTTGYYFPSVEVPGMFSLNANQQIEERKREKVVINGSSDSADSSSTSNKTETVYLYWIFNDAQAVYDYIAAGNEAYTLADDEYIFYTDVNKTSMSYYGAGSELVFHNRANIVPSGETVNSVAKISKDDIFSGRCGITDIPWIRQNFGTNSTDPYLQINIYQYIRLAANDALLNLKFISSSETMIDSEHWKGIESAEYRQSGAIHNLTKLDIEEPNSIASSNGGSLNTWEVRSRLILDLSPIKAQKIYENEKITLIFNSGNPVELEPRWVTDTNINKTIPQPIAIKANYFKYSVLDETSVKTYKLKTPGEGLEEVNDFKIKLFDQQDVGAVYNGSNIDTSVVKFHNFNNKFTSIVFAGMASSEDYLKFYVNVPENSFGLLTINYTGQPIREETNKIVHSSYIQLEALDKKSTADKKSTVSPVIYNYWNKPENPSLKKEIWWTNEDLGISKPETDTNYYLKGGINAIKFTDSCILKIYPDSNNKESIILSDLAIIDKEDPINFDLLRYQNDTPKQFRRIDIDGSQKPDLDTKDYIAWKNKNSTTSEAPIYELYSAVDNEELKSKFKSFNSQYEWYEAEKHSTDQNKAEQISDLLAQINKLDTEHKFFYNCPLDNSIALDFNAKLLGIDDRENLASPSAWYDYNNINNNFVISEIDADDLDVGIAIARSSKAPEGYHYYD